jgi:cyclopropane fatty-acyl-phospholipid synthase-like methyltransferase
MKQDFWNSRYQKHESSYGYEPNQFLVSAADFLHPYSRVLSVGEGEGRNCVWLAQRELDIWAMDYSLTGLKKARKMADSYHLQVKCVCADVQHWFWPPDFFDAIILIFVHFAPVIRPDVHRNMMRSLKSGGYVVMQAFHKKQLQYSSGGPKSEEMLYTADILRQDFRTGEIVQLDEIEDELSEGLFHNGPASVINFIVRKK